jgi:hypothetical protein
VSVRTARSERPIRSFFMTFSKRAWFARGRFVAV